MQYKVIGDDLVKLPIRTVDTGYGLDRFAWLSQGVPSCFHAIYGDLLNNVFKMAGLANVDDKFLCKVAKYSGLVSVDKTANRLDARRRVAKLVSMNMSELDKVLAPFENAFGRGRPHKMPQFPALGRSRPIKYPRRLPSEAAFPKSLPTHA